MYLQLLFTFAALQITTANNPVIFQKDNSVIATEPMKVSLPQHHNFVPVHYPRYEVVNNKPEAPTLSNSDRLPADLIEIAATKLGIQNLDNIPSVSELAELLGTTSREETIDSIRQLTATDSGIDLIKAFIESSDYTDSTETKDSDLNEVGSIETSETKNLLSEAAEKDLELLQEIVSTPKPELNFFQRATSYLNFFDLFPENKEIPIAPVNKEVQQLKPKSLSSRHVSHHQRHPKLQPILATLELPSSFPVPIMPSGINPSSSSSLNQKRPVKESHYRLNEPILDNRYLN